jgi:hypothetical protein
LSLLDFQTWFPDEDSCYQLLLDRRWPNAFLVRDRLSVEHVWTLVKEVRQRLARAA